LGGIPTGLLLRIALDDVLEDLLDALRQGRKIRQNTLGNIYCPTHSSI